MLMILYFGRKKKRKTEWEAEHKQAKPSLPLQESPLSGNWEPSQDIRDKELAMLCEFDLIQL